jgi:hypothetical protein
MSPGPVLALLRVERDTTLPHASVRSTPMSLLGVRPGRADSLLAMPGDPMPAARVRLLRMDSTTRQRLAVNGVRDSVPVAFIRAAPYRADCRTIRWTDSVPFTVAGEVGFVRAVLASADQWIGGAPVFVIAPAWSYPYPHRRGLAFGVTPDAPLASAEAMYDLVSALEIPPPPDAAARLAADSARRVRAIAWARANPAPAELEPARTMIRRAVLEPDWEVTRRLTSRLRGTYRVDVELGGERGTWFFRTHDRPGYVWRRADAMQTTAALLESPAVPGYQLAGLAGASRDALPTVYPRGGVRGPLVWLATADRPTTPGNESRLALPGELQFQLGAAPEWLWDALERLVPPQSAMDSALQVRLNRPIERPRRQPRISLTVRLDALGGVRADTAMDAGGRTIRVTLERVDTLSMRRPF